MFNDTTAVVTNERGCSPLMKWVAGKTQKDVEVPLDGPLPGDEAKKLAVCIWRCNETARTIPYATYAIVEAQHDICSSVMVKIVRAPKETGTYSLQAFHQFQYVNVCKSLYVLTVGVKNCKGRHCRGC